MAAYRRALCRQAHGGSRHHRSAQGHPQRPGERGFRRGHGADHRIPGGRHPRTRTRCSCRRRRNGRNVLIRDLKEKITRGRLPKCRRLRRSSGHSFRNGSARKGRIFFVFFPFPLKEPLMRQDQDGCLFSDRFFEFSIVYMSFFAKLPVFDQKFPKRKVP